ncbi:hypothetical protein K2173_008993 [Erythroxylum novogranatense]|uniref:26S proteasome regulatory subunit RPN11 C-terminal domain-containing protein n=1 Tax=Erythroxylum novogranatense TaxID=1862640 RepID=A0AAV8TSH8_9ROSI|nr:hypothetical protein K2173_008993 [Erythroxylum novogranatense]
MTTLIFFYSPTKLRMNLKKREFILKESSGSDVELREVPEPQTHIEMEQEPQVDTLNVQPMVQGTHTIQTCTQEVSSHPGDGGTEGHLDRTRKVAIDAFRLINPQTMMLGQEPRQTTSNLGHPNKPSIQLSFLQMLLALIHGLNRLYYSIAINYRKNELEEKMLLNLHKKKWTNGLTLRLFETHSKTNEQTVQEMLNLAIKYNKEVQEEDELPPEKLAIANVGRQDAKKHLEEHVSNLMSSNIVQSSDSGYHARHSCVLVSALLSRLQYCRLFSSRKIMSL